MTTACTCWRAHRFRAMARRGIVIDIQRTANAIRRAIEDAELQAGVDIDSATVGVANSNIRSLNSEGVVAVRGAAITPADVRRCIEAAKTQAIPADREVIHSLLRATPSTTTTVSASRSAWQGGVCRACPRGDSRYSQH